MNNQGNMGTQKENEEAPKTNSRVMEDCDLNDIEFKISVMKKLGEIQYN